MNLKNQFKAFAKRMPRVRGFTKRFYFAHPFLDAWFAWFPLNQIQYDGAAVGEIFNAAKKKRIVAEAECGEAHCQLNNFPLARQIMFDWIESIAPKEKLKLAYKYGYGMDNSKPA